jgi:hypothetical protein
MSTQLLQPAITILPSLEQDDNGGMHLRQLARQYRNGDIQLSENQQFLFNAIFNGRKDQLRFADCLGEALQLVLEIIDCDDIEMVQKELEWWI